MTDVAAPVGRRERKKEETKQRIFLAALKLFNGKGFEATTIDDITEAADVSKGTFFNYFPRKEAVIEYLAEEWIDEVAEVAADPTQSAAERGLTLYATASAAYDENPELARLVVRSSVERFCCPSPDGAWARFDQMIVDIVKDGQARGEFRPLINPHAIYGVLGSCFIGSLIWWLGPRERMDDPAARQLSLKDVVRMLQQTALDGIRAPSGGVA